jgi:hypothetical protein
MIQTCFTLQLDPSCISKYEKYHMSHTFRYGLLFALTKLVYNAVYLGLKFTEENINKMYCGIMIANLLLLVLVSMISYKSYFFCKVLAFWSIIGLFLESFQYEIFTDTVDPLSHCSEHQLRFSSFIPLTYFTAALLQDNWFLISIVRTAALVGLTASNVDCGFSDSNANYQVWIIGESFVYLFVAYLCERKRKAEFEKNTGDSQDVE